MTVGIIDYQIEKYPFSCADERPGITWQWADVLEECRQLKAGAAERLHIALLNVDCVTHFELPFRLLLIRTPQLITDLRNALLLNQKEAIFNGKRFGCKRTVYDVWINWLIPVTIMSTIFSDNGHRT